MMTPTLTLTPTLAAVQMTLHEEEAWTTTDCFTNDKSKLRKAIEVQRKHCGSNVATGAGVSSSAPAKKQKREDKRKYPADATPEEKTVAREWSNITLFGARVAAARARAHTIHTHITLLQTLIMCFTGD